MPRLALPSGLDRWAIRGVRVPAALLDAPAPSADPEGLCGVDVLISDGRIEAIGSALDIGPEVPFVAAGWRPRAAGSGRCPYASRQGSHGAAGQKPGRDTGWGARGRGGGPDGPLDGGGRPHPDGVRPPLRLCARHRGHPDPHRQPRAADPHLLAGLRRHARGLARPDRPAGLAAVRHRCRARRRAYAGHRGHGRSSAAPRSSAP